MNTPSSSSSSSSSSESSPVRSVWTRLFSRADPHADYTFFSLTSQDRDAFHQVIQKLPTRSTEVANLLNRANAIKRIKLQEDVASAAAAAAASSSPPSPSSSLLIQELSASGLKSRVPLPEDRFEASPLTLEAERDSLKSLSNCMTNQAIVSVFLALSVGFTTHKILKRFTSFRALPVFTTYVGLFAGTGFGFVSMDSCQQRFCSGDDLAARRARVWLHEIHPKHPYLRNHVIEEDRELVERSDAQIAASTSL